MAVLNVHERELTATPAEVGVLLDTLASGEEDQFWPHEVWPALHLDGPVAVGAAGGHGPIAYCVEGYAPGAWVRFRFTEPRGFRGFHDLAVLPVPGHPDRAVLRHTLTMRTRGAARLSWPLLFRHLHDALMEDGLHRAATVVGATQDVRPRWSPYVRLLRTVLHRSP